MPDPTSKIFLLQKNVSLCLSAPTKKTIISFPWTGIFCFVLEFGKIQLQSEKRYFIGVLSTNNCWIQAIKRWKKHCQTSLWKIKMLRTNVLEEEPVIKQLQFLNQNMKLFFRLSFLKHFLYSKLFSLIFVFIVQTR